MNRSHPCVSLQQSAPSPAICNKRLTSRPRFLYRPNRGYLDYRTSLNANPYHDPIDDWITRRSVNRLSPESKSHLTRNSSSSCPFLIMFIPASNSSLTSSSGISELYSNWSAWASVTVSLRLMSSCARHLFVAASSRRTFENVASRNGSGRHCRRA